MLSENLGININIEPLQFAQHQENIETGKALFWRTSWIADYPDPENFLNLIYGDHVPENLSDKSFINSLRFQNENFDKKFNVALREVNSTKRYELYRQADQIAMDAAAILPIFYDENTRLLQIHVKNFPANGMEYRDFTRVYFDYEEQQ